MNGEAEIMVDYHVSLSNGREFATNAPVPFASSNTQVNNAIAARVIAQAPEFGGFGMQSSDVKVFGGVS